MKYVSVFSAFSICSLPQKSEDVRLDATSSVAPPEVSVAIVYSATHCVCFHSRFNSWPVSWSDASCQVLEFISVSILSMFFVSSLVTCCATVCCTVEINTESVVAKFTYDEN